MPRTKTKIEPVNKTSAKIRKRVLDYVRAGIPNRQIARDLDIGEASVRRIRQETADEPQEAPLIVHEDKKVGHFDWRESVPIIEQFQRLRSQSSWSQEHAKIVIGDGRNPIAIMFLSDMHIGAIGTDYRKFVELTDFIINTPNLFVAIVGDVVEMAIKLRSVAEVCAQILDPHMQVAFMESWIEEIKHKVVFCTWGNHESDRNEALAGTCPIKDVLARRAPYFSGIGHADVTVGSETYKFAVSHKFQGVTQLDATAGCKKYLRQEYPEGEIAVQGDCHRSGISLYNEGGKRRIAITSGTLNIKSGFAQRYFSLKTSTAFPVVQLWHDRHMVVPFFTIAEWLNTIGVDTPIHEGL